MISDVPYVDQKGYLDEALRCLKADANRAATVLGWSAAMYQIHCKPEAIGFGGFNAKSSELASQKKGHGFSRAAKLELLLLEIAEESR